MIFKATMKRIWLCSVPALLTSAALLAQMPPGGGGQQPNAPNQQQPPGANMPSTGAIPGTAPTAETYGEQAFIAKAMERNEAQVQFGQLAEQKSQSNDIKKFAQSMVSQHQQMTDKWLKPVANKLGASEPKGPSKKAKKEMKKLQGLSGQQFDSEYLQAAITNTKEDLKDFKSEATSAQDPNVKQIAQQGSGIMSKDLQLAKQIAQSHNVPLRGQE
jgi:putative membrane protein